MKKRILPALLAFVFVLTLLPIHAQALGGVVQVTLKSGLDGVADIVLESFRYGLYVTSEEDSVNGKFLQEKADDTLYTRYKVSDVPDSFGRTDLLCWKYTFVEHGYTTIVHPGEVISDLGSGGHYTLEAIWIGLEQNSYAFSSPQSVTVTENTEFTSIPFTVSELTLGSADIMSVRLRSGDFSYGENTIHYDSSTAAEFSAAGQTDNCSIRISPEEWAKAKAGSYTATLEYDVTFELGTDTIRTLHGSVPMTLQVGHKVTVSANDPSLGTASASAAMARAGDATTATATFTMPAEAVTLTATYEAITYPVTVDVQGDANKISYILWAKAGKLFESSSFAEQGAQPVETAIPEGCTLGLEVTSQGAESLFLEISSTTTSQVFHSFSFKNVCRAVAKPTGPVTVTLVVDPAWLTLHPNGAAGDEQTLLAPINCAATVPDNPFTRDGYKFTGWNTAADGSGTAYDAGDTITPTGNITLYAQWKAAYAYVTAATASFNDKISLNFYIEIPEGWRDGAYAVLTCGSDTKTVLVSEAIRSKETERVGYKFSYALLAKQIEDEVTIRLYDAEGQPLPLKNQAGTNDYTETGVPMTVLRYVNAMIEKGSDSMKALAQAAKDYGYAAKQKFSGGSCTISSAVAGVSAGDLNAYAAQISGALPAGVEVEFITAMFESDNAFRLYLRFADTVNVDTLQFWLDDPSHPLTLQTRSDGKQYLTFTGVTSTKLGEAHTFHISDGSDTCSIRVSVLTYARSVLTNDATAPMKTLAQALYLYNQKALAHFSNN